MTLIKADYCSFIYSKSLTEALTILSHYPITIRLTFNSQLSSSKAFAFEVYSMELLNRKIVRFQYVNLNSTKSR